MEVPSTIDRLRQLSPFGLPEWIADSIRRRYTGPERAYHNLRHLDEMAASFEEVRRDVGWERPRDVFAALVLHDLVYVPGDSANEELSAHLAVSFLALLEDVHAENVTRLIRLTAQHGRLKPADVPELDAQLFLDCDMAILGAPRQRFLEYDAQIAAEYAPVLSADVYARGRRAFLERLADPEHRIFLSTYFHDRLESKAKDNLRALLGGSFTSRRSSS